ncbi:MAG: cytochrome c oxidase assembly protein, partial [Methylobacter sp.]
MNESVTQKNAKLVRILVFVVLGMFGFGYALVPLYDVLCEVTGLNGK